MSPSRRSRTLIALAVVTLGAAPLAACGSSSTSSDSGRISVVASTDVWGAVAGAVAGDKADVSSLYTSPDGDPHEFEATARDTAKIADAGVVVLNGADYDHYMEEAEKGPDAAVVSADDVYKGLNPDASTKAGAVNEHFFYNLTVVAGVADKIADALADKAPDDAATFRANASAFTAKIDGLKTRLAQIKAAHNGAKVAQTEPLAAYLLADAGLIDATPEGFTEAVESGQDPAAADIATTQDLIRDKTVTALLYNTQAVDDITKNLLTTAEGNRLPVVKLTETLPSGVTDYIAWQTATVDAIATAVS
ncbi:zinc ABC transporter substrate-binding protein [Williamsia sp.]|uniref:metal ABC transporter solute-binding protein, Zn/Mn family n=1 Tax=Williamsia sp. TaxID=1872085 RepID=UPI001A248A97|nr:zinc ABC transporter substrate-binding protein [Williamsia sp.]MBJ7290603.1 zinc ABC transporter substrate-binding protein [Williamsia sp.]